MCDDFKDTKSVVRMFEEIDSITKVKVKAIYISDIRPNWKNTDLLRTTIGHGIIWGTKPFVKNGFLLPTTGDECEALKCLLSYIKKYA